MAEAESRFYKETYQGTQQNTPNPFEDHWNWKALDNSLASLAGDSSLAAACQPSAPGSIDAFLEEVRSSCEHHAQRKGYLEESGNVAGEITRLLGIGRDHAIGEIAYKLLEFRKFPRKVIAVKVAGWAWRLWLEAKE